MDPNSVDELGKIETMNTSDGDSLRTAQMDPNSVDELGKIETMNTSDGDSLRTAQMDPNSVDELGKIETMDTSDDDSLRTAQRKESEVFSNDKVSLLENQEYSLNEDIFTFLAVTPCNSSPSLYAFFVFLMQILILWLMVLNKFVGNTALNPFNTPPHSPILLDIAQAIAILLSVCISNDIIQALNYFLIPYNPAVIDVFPTASRLKRRVSYALRFLEGSLVLLASFLFILQEVEVLDLFLNFAAVQFVSELDNIAFFLASSGYIPNDNIRTAAKLIQTVTWDQKQCAKKKKRNDNILLALLLFTMYGGWITVKIRQARGAYYQDYCGRFDVDFGNKKFNFFETMCRTNRKECPETWMNSENPISYGSFNDVYEMQRHDDETIVLYNSRPVYIQRGRQGRDGFGKDQSAGEIKYCKQENAWVFTIPGVSKGANANDCSWLLKSSETDALTLDDVPEGDWKIWTGTIEESNVDITCVDCEDNIRSDEQTGVMSCNFNGRCDEDSRKCQCEYPFMGSQCSICGGCSVLLLDMADIRFRRLDDGEEPFSLYGRPVFFYDHHLNPNPTANFDDELVVISYTGEFWAVFNKTIEFGDHIETETVMQELLEFFQTFHSQWDLNSGIIDPWFLSLGETKAHTPVYVDTWVNMQKQENVHISFLCPNNEESTCGLVF